MTNSASSPIAIPEFSTADRLRKARQFAGLTPEELAERIGVTPRTVYNYETGKPTRPAALKLWALATGVPFQWIETGEYDPATDSVEGASTDNTCTPSTAGQDAYALPDAA
jgi:transcriptional regulator with XRE-family HTH domain